MSEDRLYAKAAQLYREGNLEAAKAILEALDTPQARSALNRVNSAISAKKQAALQQHRQTGEKPKNTDLAGEIAKGIKQAKAEERQAKAKQQGIGCLVVLALCGACWLFSLFIAQPRPAENVAKMCELVRSVNLRCDPAEILRDYPSEVAYCQETYGNFVDVEELKYTWQNCLRSQGVVFWPE